MQLGHSYNEESTMHPFYKNNIGIDINAQAGGTHVANESTTTSCEDPITLGTIPGCTTSTEENYNGKDISIFPNPGSQTVYISSDLNLVDSKIKIYNLGGELVKILNSNEQSINIDISRFAKGVYFVEIQKNNILITKKLIVL